MRQGSYGAGKLSNHVVFHRESAGDVHCCVAPHNFYEKGEQLVLLTKQIRKKVLGGWKMKCRGSSETCFDNFKILNGECLRGKRPFKVLAL